ncbi:hypothetical protein ACFZC5_34935 [Nocardia gamkensis]|uniref:hypothetical protein n=1 Tax=Nocardia gamkensis TaxID=352869 RepID=UPI0036E344DA
MIRSAIAGAKAAQTPHFDAEINKWRNLIERVFNSAKHWCAVAARLDNLAITYHAGFVRPSSNGANHRKTRPSLHIAYD